MCKTSVRAKPCFRNPCRSEVPQSARERVRVQVRVRVRVQVRVRVRVQVRVQVQVQVQVRADRGQLLGEPRP